MWPEAAVLRVFLARVRRRRDWIAALEGAAAGLGAGFLLAMFVSLGTRSLSLAALAASAMVSAAAGALLRVLHSRRTAVAQQIERRAPGCRNLIITAAELLEVPGRVGPYMGQLVQRDAVRLLHTLEPARLFPARRALAGFAAALALWTLVLAVVTMRPPALEAALKAAVTEATIDHIDVTITPPGYSGRPEQKLENPTRIEALAGSRITLSVRAEAHGITLETLSGRLALRADNGARFTGAVLADADGYIALEADAGDSTRTARRLIGLSVTADAPPRVRLTAPGRDLFLPNATRTIAVAIEADDDLGLASLKLRYTKVSGAGEQFSFTEGELPIETTRSDARSWRARGNLQLPALALRAGDVLVYRAVAVDQRPGAPPVESDAFLVEITAPGAVAAEGFSLDEEQDRYALSQQMVILKTERLIARAASMPRDSVTHAALTIAAEQRSVRAEFVFMMGGELAEEILAEASMDDLNEEAHAEADDEAIAGRLANRGRVDLLLAIRAMSRANTLLNNASLAEALQQEKTALNALQRAFSRTRYILRALTQRERLDLTRRLTGVLSTAGRAQRPLGESASNPRVVALRHALAGVAALAGTRLDAQAAARATALAASVLQVDPAAAQLQEVAAVLAAAGTAIASSDVAAGKRELERATLLLAAHVRELLVAAPPQDAGLELGRLQGALTDALRQAGAR